MINKWFRRVMDWCSLCVVMLFVFASVTPAGAQEGSIQEAEKLSQQVIQLYEKGRYSEAIALATQALAIREEVLGPMHPATATALNNLALLYRFTGAYDKAAPLYQRALTIYEQVLGPTHADTATALDNLADLYHIMGAYEKAALLIQQALVIREDALGPMHPATALSLNNLGLLYSDRGAYDKAKPLFQRALAIREEVLGPMHPDTATALDNLAVFYYDTGANDKAVSLYQRALAIREEVLGPVHPDMALLLSNLALFYSDMGAYDKAKPLFQRALAIREEVLGPMHADTATTLHDLARLYRFTGAYDKAEPLYQRALAIYEQALGPMHADTATALNNLAGLYSHTGAYDKAESFYQRALAIREQTLGPMHPDTATSLNCVAEFYRISGAYAKAKPLFQRALAIREEVLGPTHADTATVLNNLGLLYSDRGAYDKAVPLYQRALAIYEQALGPMHAATATALNNLALLHWASGNPATAQAFFERAQTIQENNAAAFLLSGSEARKHAYVQQLRWITFVKISLSLTEADRQATALSFKSVLYSKGRVLDAMSDSVARLRQSVRPEDRKLFEHFTDVVQQRSTLPYRGPGELPLNVFRTRLRALVTEQEQLEEELAARSAEFRQQLAPITLAAVQAVLSPESALIEWFLYDPFDPNAKGKRTVWGKPRYVAYVLKRFGEPVAVDLGEAKSIELLVQGFRNALSDPQNLYAKEVAQELSERLIKPLRRHLDNTERLIISPDGALNLVPFAALLDETGHYLGTTREITYVTSGRDLLRYGTTPVAKGDAVVVADPDYGPFATSVIQTATTIQLERSVDLDRSGLVFTPLLGTAAEAKALSPLLKVKDEHLLTQAKATEARLKQLHHPRILHIATHGFFLSDKEMAASMLKTVGFSQDPRPLPLGENPLLRSGLALAGANVRRSGEKDDGILTAAEVAQMDLRGTQLVVLSACETGVGEVQNGEGVYGLRRALVLAGAQTQVASLWKVADEATKDLMVAYYQRLLKGEGRSAALREAQDTMINSEDRSHPYYWAAFVPIGNWKPLTQ